MDLTTVDLLARLQLHARRRGFELRLRRAPRELAELIELCGLLEVLGLDATAAEPPSPGRKSRGQPEEREERLRVEEERQLPDPPA